MPQITDKQLDTVWQLYAEGRYSDVRKAIAERQAASPIGSPQPISWSVLPSQKGVLNCTEIDVLWRVAEAFAKTDRPQRAVDALVPAGPAQTVSEKVSEDADRSAGVELLPQDQSEASFADTAAVDETGAKTEDTAEGAPASIRAGRGSPSYTRSGVDVSAVHDSMEVEPAAEGPARKHRALIKNTRLAVGGAQVSEGPRASFMNTESV